VRAAHHPVAAVAVVVLFVGWFAPLVPSAAWALDKQGSAHGGDVDDNPDGFDVSGAASVGLSIVNRSYAARPDNTGLVLMRYAGHADVDLIGERLSVPLDVNIFSDRLRDGLGKVAPSELDFIGGLTTTFPVLRGQIELGARLESDQTADRENATSQFYVDTRARYLYSLDKYFPSLAAALRDGDVSGWATLGWFTYNRSYFARPDNTGLAFLRYGLHGELSTFGDLWSLGLDATMFTDKNAPNPLGPSELDLTPELIFHVKAYEVHLAWESDRPLDRGGLVQQFVYVLGVWSFDLVSDKPKPFESRGQILSP
jgi:hypothetical protein